jgi:hypothetical protein
MRTLVIRTLHVVLITLFTSGCARLEYIRAEVCEYKPEIIGAIELICSADSLTSARGLDSLRTLHRIITR